MGTAVRAYGMVVMAAETEDTLVETGALVGVKGPIPTPHAPNTDSFSSADSRPKIVEVGRDKLGKMCEHGGLVWSVEKQG